MDLCWEGQRIIWQVTASFVLIVLAGEEQAVYKSVHMYPCILNKSGLLPATGIIFSLLLLNNILGYVHFS